ncbi:MAG: ABC transporter permease subunit [Chloroflexi bacterium AL-N5]|nr:ABC transporter permease subunit [Chloroflexi bacterium AL-N5]
MFKARGLNKPSPFGAFLSYLVLVFWAVVVLFPLYWLFVTSFKLPFQVNEGPYYLPFVDFQPSDHAWRYIFVDVWNDTVRPYTNTVIVAIFSSILALIFGGAAAYGLTRFRYRPRLMGILLFIVLLALAIVATNAGLPWQLALSSAAAVFFLLIRPVSRRFPRSLGNNDIAFWLISQRILPPVAVVIPIYVMFQQFGMLDTRAALIITYMAINLPIVVWLMRDYFSNIPIELEESARVDGASPYRIFWSIVLPLSTPGLVATFLFVLVFAWNEYLLALFLSSANAQTMPLLVAAQNATRGPQWWYMSVLILIMIIPVIVLAIMLERYISRGLLVGAVKG